MSLRYLILFGFCFSTVLMAQPSSESAEEYDEYEDQYEASEQEQSSEPEVISEEPAPVEEEQAGTELDAAEPPENKENIESNGQPDGEPVSQPSDAAVAEDGPTSAQSLNTERSSTAKDKKIFGSYRLRLGVQKPTFDDGQKHYEQYYGNTKAYPMFQADWFAWDWYVSLGLSFRLGYYRATGYTSTTDPEASTYTKNKESPTTLIILPIQIAVIGEMTPFDGKWAVLDFWLGIENATFQETRNIGSEQSSTSESETGVLANSGTKLSSTFGVSMNILLNQFDRKTVNSMRPALGLGSVYISPYVEIVRQLSKEGVSLGRSSVGLGFTYETI